MQRTRWTRRGAALLLSLAAAGCGGVLDSSSDREAAERAVDRWVRDHPDGWTLRLQDARPLVRAEWSTPCSRPQPSGMVTMSYRSQGTEIDLGFRCPVGAAAGAPQLQAAFAYAALQRLPHGISVPGWDFHVLTPSSSVGQGTTFSTPAPGRLLVSLETPLYAVYGRSLAASCQPPADGPLPEGCYVSREHRVPLSLRLEVPLDLSALER